MARIDIVRRVDLEPDRAVVRANGIVLDVTANDDGTVYVEAYAYHGSDGFRVVTQAAQTDTRHPSFTFGLREELAGT